MSSCPHSNPRIRHCRRVHAALAILTSLCMAVTACLAAPREVAKGTLSVVSDPPECAVLIDHVQRGATPFETELPPGNYLVTVQREGHRPEHRQVTIAAESRRHLSLDPAPLTGLLLVHSAPPGATLTIDGLDHGRTPALISTLPLGTYRVQLDLPGYRPRTVEVVLSDRTPRYVKLDLASDSATLNIRASVTGAEVYLNGMLRGTSPCTIERIPAGEVVLDIKAPGYITHTRILKLSESEIHDIAVQMEEQPATLRVVSIPDGGRVYLDNEFKGETPLVLESVTPGEHRVRVDLAGFEPNARTLTLERGTQSTEEFRLTGNTGRIMITTDPDDVTVLVNGVDRGKTTAAGGEGVRVSAPLSIDLLPEGTYAIKFVRPGYHEQAREVVVTRGRTETLHASLERRFIPDYTVTTSSGTYRGVLHTRSEEAIRLETAPGVISTYQMRDVRRHGPLAGAAAP